jgi:fumarylacetoacetate (FAA) hydrolase family protein
LLRFARNDSIGLVSRHDVRAVEDRDAPGQGFTHKEGDIVTISSPKLGALVNRVGRSDNIPPWEFGALALMRNLAGRGLP